jgi:hypothetical protein
MQETITISYRLTGGKLTIDWDKKEIIYQPKSFLSSYKPSVVIPFANLVSAEAAGSFWADLLSKYGDNYSVKIGYKDRDEIKYFNFKPVTLFFINLFEVPTWVNKFQSIINSADKGLAVDDIPDSQALTDFVSTTTKSTNALFNAVIIIIFAAMVPMCCVFLFGLVISLASSIYR